MILASLLGGIGTTEILIILAVALLLLGPKKLPEIAKTIGKGLREFRKSANEFTSSLNLDEDERKSPLPPKAAFNRPDVYAQARAEAAEEAAREAKVVREPLVAEPVVTAPSGDAAPQAPAPEGSAAEAPGPASTSSEERPPLSPPATPGGSGAASAPVDDAPTPADAEPPSTTSSS